MHILRNFYAYSALFQILIIFHFIIILIRCCASGTETCWYKAFKTIWNKYFNWIFLLIFCHFYCIFVKIFRYVFTHIGSNYHINYHINCHSSLCTYVYGFSYYDVRESTNSLNCPFCQRWERKQLQQQDWTRCSQKDLFCSWAYFVFSLVLHRLWEGRLGCQENSGKFRAYYHKLHRLTAP